MVLACFLGKLNPRDFCGKLSRLSHSKQHWKKTGKTERKRKGGGEGKKKRKRGEKEGKKREKTGAHVAEGGVDMVAEVRVGGEEGEQVLVALQRQHVIACAPTLSPRQHVIACAPTLSPPRVSTLSPASAARYRGQQH
eukprot:649686-Rhodomonas_salina.2